MMGPQGVQQRSRRTFEAHRREWLFTHIGKDKCSLLHVRTFTMMMLSFVGFLKYSEDSELH